MHLRTQSCMSSKGPRSKFLEWGLFLAPLFLLNYFLFNLFLFLQKKWGGGGRGAFSFTRSLVVVIVVIERDRLFGKLYR